MNKNIHIQNTNQDELIKIFKIMPSYCGCSSCTDVKEKVKTALGIKEFKKLAKKLKKAF